MPFKELFLGYPFSGCNTKYFMPPGPNDWQPKAWGLDAYASLASTDITDDDATFEDDNVQVGDVFYIVDAIPYMRRAGTVLDVWSQTSLRISFGFGQDTIFIHYKVGMKAPHSIQTLMTILDQRNVHNGTIHWATVWTGSPIITFNHTELGDVYVCHNPGEQRRQELRQQWLDENPASLDPNPWDNLNPEPDL
jgi:hypothetical protein